MPVPTWLSALGHFASDVVGTMLGIQVTEARRKAVEIAGTELKRVLMPDREDVMKEILYLGDEAKALHDLLAEAEHCFVEVEGKRYAENWIINMLLKVDPKDRGWVFRMLNEILVARGRRDFFTHLEILHNDGWLQYLKLAKAEVGEVIESMKEKLPESKELKRRLGSADEAVNNAILQLRAKQRWFKGRRARQDRLRSQLLELQERQTRGRVEETYDQFWPDWSDKRGGQQ